MKEQDDSPLVGIDDISIHFPKLFLDMRDFAEMRDVDYEKLSKGLGLEAMAVPDMHEDTATMGANAVVRLIDRNGLQPSKIGRMYLGTESALDGSKPTATYILDMLLQRYGEEHGSDCFANCDVVDMTFACIGAVDALHNTLDWVARGGVEEDRIGIVIFADNAKYEMGSSGEYTQGAGGGAILIRHEPRLLAIPDVWGVSTTPVHDFFKPRREVSITSIINSILELARETGQKLKSGLAERMVKHLPASMVRDEGIFTHGHETIQVHKDTPVFDGQYSNRCYQEAVKQAFDDFRHKAIRSGRFNAEKDTILTEQWSRIIMHLPYAFQGKRMFPDIFRHDRRGHEVWRQVEEEIGPEPLEEEYEDHPDGPAEFRRDSDTYRRKISKTQCFTDFAEQKIEKGQRASSLIGNQYTGSIFLALMSTFESDYLENASITGTRFGLCGYGSGAKAKVFEAIVQPEWKQIAAGFHLFDRLSRRQPITREIYEGLHRGTLEQSVLEPESEFALVEVTTDGRLAGVRSYKWFTE